MQDWDVILSIIPKGRVEEIFNSNRKNAGQYFWKAAGVLKFKTTQETETKPQSNPGKFGPSGGHPLWIRRTNPSEKQATVVRRFWN